jgi:putative membrane protein
MSISTEDRDRIARAINDAESRTSGEIVCVLARSSVGATALPILIAAVIALALPWLLLVATEMPVQRMLSLQALAFLVLALVLSLPRVRVALMPRRARRAIAWRAAMEQFATRGLAQKKDRCSILIFVSLAEHYARIIADDGIAERVPQKQWQAAVDALVTHMREDRIADGFVAAIDACGEELARHFPRAATSRDELPDRIYLI